MSDTLLARLNELETRKAALEAEIAGMQCQTDIVHVDPNVILSQYAEVKDSPASPMYKAFIKSLITRIEVGRYLISVTLKTGLDIFPSLDTTYEVRRQEVYERGKKTSA